MSYCESGLSTTCHAGASCEGGKACSLAVDSRSPDTLTCFPNRQIQSIHRLPSTAYSTNYLSRRSLARRWINFLLPYDSRCPTQRLKVRLMNKHPILPNWQVPRRRSFTARRGIALLRAWRQRFADQPREPYVQTQFAFARLRVARRGG